MSTTLDEAPQKAPKQVNNQPSNAKLEKLKTLLKELFQLDQPDLDFGLYRIMHAKSAEISKFLDEDLLPQVKEAFAQYQSADKADLEKELGKAIEQAQGLGVDPETTQKVKDLREKIANESVDIGALENEVYDHLYSFFRRYYTDGDFMAKRVYKPGVYAIPYEGEEVKLHWANKDQYYIKTSDYLRDYTFRLRPESQDKPMRVHFKLVDAAEGEHGNVKAAEGKDRVFVLASNELIALVNGELEIRFEYRPATLNDWPEATRQEKKKPPTQKELIGIATEEVLGYSASETGAWIKKLSVSHTKAGGDSAEYSLLEAHLRRYTARNTFDYFVHKELGTFLRREFDFFLKSEILHLDDVENETAANVGRYLSRLKCIRFIGKKIIEFLEQTENFQKALWLKKKLVTRCDYLVPLHLVPLSFYGEITNTKAQVNEWVDLLALHKQPKSLDTLEFTTPPTSEFLQANPSLVLDTRHFRDDFKERLVNELGDLEASSRGLVVHSENFQGLNLIRRRLSGQVNSIYIDPPYNTDAGPISYKNGYRSSSWMSLIADRVQISKEVLADDGILCATIDDYQQKELQFILEEVFGNANLIGTVAIRNNPSGRPVPRGLSQSHEYAMFVAKSEAATASLLPRTDAQLERYKERDEVGIFMWETFRKRGSNSERKDRPSLYYPIFYDGEVFRVPKIEWDSGRREWALKEKPSVNEDVLYPIDDNGVERTWRWQHEALVENPSSFSIKDRSGKPTVYYKFRPNEVGVTPLTLWADAKYSANEHGTGVLKKLFKEYNVFSYPKSIYAVEDCISIAGMRSPTAMCLDYFGGSGTTAHAVLNLNASDGGNRRFVLIEMGAYIDSVLIPRIKKVMFTPHWKDGEPEKRIPRKEASRHGIVKVVRLESYEDTLNNLELRRNERQASLLEGTDRRKNAFKEQYYLRYMLDVETRGSQSLLNVKDFKDPTAYKLRVKQPGSDESKEVNVDLLETFNWLIGLTVKHIAAPKTFQAEFKRDPENRLKLTDRLKEDKDGPWWFRKVEGTTPDGRKTLVIWRKLTDDIEQDNLVLDEWLKKQGVNTKDFEFDLIYVNGDNNLENLKTPDDTWKVRLIEEDFHRLMFDTEDA